MPTILDFSDIKNMLELENTSFSDYPDLELMADNVHAALENYCGRMLDFKQKKTETGFIRDATYIDLTSLPLNSITSLVVGDDTLTSDDYTVTDYEIMFNKSFTNKIYTLVCKGGWSEIPEDVYRAELSQVVYEYQQKNNIGTTNFSNDGGTTTSPGFRLLPEVKRLLNPYTHPKKVGF